MSFLKDKLGRSAVVVAFSLGAFQVLSIIGATSASAATACGVSSPGVLTITAAANLDNILVYQDDTVAGGIRVSGNNGASKPTPGTATDLTNCGAAGVTAATLGTITTIQITGDSGGGLAGDQTVFVSMAKWTPGAPALVTATLAKWGAINWTISLGGNGVNGDSLVVWNEGNTTAGMAVTGGVNGLDLNTDGDLDATVAGTELFYFDSNSNGAPATALTNPGNTVDLNGSTITGGPFATGAIIGLHPTVLNAGFAASAPVSDMNTDTGDNLLSGGIGNDTIKGGLAADTIAPGLGNDNVDCFSDAAPSGVGFEGDGNDTLDYTTTTAAINVNMPGLTVTQGTDVDTIVGAASISSCENVLGTSAADTFLGDSVYNWFLPGDGNDAMNGGTDTTLNGVDYSDASAGVTVDLIAGTATGGSGSDTLSNINDVFGSGSDDVITGDGSTNFLWGSDGNDWLSGGAGQNDGDDEFDGGNGVDTISYAKNTSATTVILNSSAAFSGALGLGELDTIIANTVENAELGTGNDVFTGSAFNNIVYPNGGQNALTGNLGIDTVNYSIGYTAGVTINLSGGGATSGNQDSITGFTNAVGTAFNDTMFGTDLVAGTNGANLLVGGKGSDQISANAGPDSVRAGAGNDRVRGGSGDDTLEGQGGNDNIRGSGGADDIFGGKGKDFCTGGGGNDFIKTCERPRNNGQGPNGPGLAQRR
jgi:Ca2+-binding RTX toxin-like protein